ncbi:MAG: hypothetical protein IPI33_16625 [Dehalococcoidia bacterium]|nr:hypothetical protein [Dehalococcoidia bacterium]
MTTKLFRESAEAFKRALAAEMGCAPEDYQSHGLAIVGRPTASREPPCPRHLRPLGPLRP